MLTHWRPGAPGSRYHWLEVAGLGQRTRLTSVYQADSRCSQDNLPTTLTDQNLPRSACSPTLLNQARAPWRRTRWRPRQRSVPSGHVRL